MSDGSSVDGVLIQWGDRLFYPGNRIVRGRPQPRLTRPGARQKADAIRARIQATVVRRAPQVMVKVTGGGRGIKAIAAHFRYISKNGRLDIEDENGTKLRGQDAVRELAEDWRFGGTLIDDIGDRREAFNIMLSMPRGSADPLIVLHAAREFARAELAGHKYIMVLHDHQANPHVHISVRAESKQGRRLNPRKADLQRWRETFADRLRGWGVDAEATRQATRGLNRNYDPLWRIKARRGRPAAYESFGRQDRQANRVYAFLGDDCMAGNRSGPRPLGRPGRPQLGAIDRNVHPGYRGQASRALARIDRSLGIERRRYPTGNSRVQATLGLVSITGPSKARSTLKRGSSSTS